MIIKIKLQVPRENRFLSTYHFFKSWSVCNATDQGITISRVLTDNNTKTEMVCKGVAQSWTSHKMEGMGERDRRSGQGDP